MVDGAQVGDGRADDPTVGQRRDGPQARAARPERDEPHDPRPHPELERLTEEVVVIGGRREREGRESRRSRHERRATRTELRDRALSGCQRIDTGGATPARPRHGTDACRTDDRAQQHRVREESRVFAGTPAIGRLGGREQGREHRFGIDPALVRSHPRPPSDGGIVPDAPSPTVEARPASYPAAMDDGDATADGRAGPEATPSARSMRRGWRGWPAIGLVIALLAAGVALQQRWVADEWRDRALALELQRDEAVGRAEALSSQLDELAELQAATSTELDALTERLAELAGEKAEAQDRALVTEIERDAAGRVAQQVASAVQGLDACILALLDLRAATVDAFNRVAAGRSVDVAPLNAQSDAAIALCNEARAAAAAAGSAAASLG